MFDLYVKELYIFKDTIYYLKDILTVLVRSLKWKEFTYQIYI